MSIRAGITALFICFQSFSLSPLYGEIQPHEYECAHPRLERFEQLNFKRKNRFEASMDATLLDGAITSFPPSKTTNDRTLSSRVRAIMDIMGNPNIAIRTAFEGRSHLRKVESAEEPRLQQEQTIHDASISLGLSYMTTTNLELTLSGEIRRIPEYEYKTVTPTVTANTKVSALQKTIPTFTALKRLPSSGAAGVFYIPHKLGTRKLTKESIETTEFSEETLFGETIGVFGRFSGLGLRGDVEVAAVNLSDGGPRKSNGQTTTDDYLRLHLLLTKSLTVPVPFDLSMRIFYKSISYATSTDVSLLTIPISQVQFRAAVGTEERNLYAGISYVYGTDRQSIPEFNADYTVTGLGAMGGIAWSL